MNLLPALRSGVPTERRLYWRVAHGSRRQEAVREGRFKLLVDEGQLLLFDLRSDPGERTDLAARHAQRVRALRRLLFAWEKQVDRDALALHRQPLR